MISVEDAKANGLIRPGDTLDRVMQITVYSDKHRGVWSRFVDASANGTLFHQQEFLDYHPPGVSCGITSFSETRASPWQFCRERSTSMRRESKSIVRPPGPRWAASSCGRDWACLERCN